ncbi:tryptophan-rich sensory protein [Acidithiobacillus sp.]
MLINWAGAKASSTPPPWVFPVVWTILFGLTEESVE